MTNPLKVFITLVIIILIGVGFYFTNYQKKIEEIKKLEVEAKDKRAELEKIQLLVKEFPKLQQEKEELEIELQNRLKEKLPPEEVKDFVPNYLAQIEQLVKDVRNATGDLSFDLLSLTPGGLAGGGGAAPAGAEGADKTKEADLPQVLATYPTRNFEMSMKGRYNTLIYFLNQLGELKLKRLVTISRIGLSPAQSFGAGVSPVLNINIPVRALLRKGGTK